LKLNYEVIKMANKIRILFLIDQLYIMGGTERQLIFLSENLPRDDFEPYIGVLNSSDFVKKLILNTPIIDFSSNEKYPIIKNFEKIINLKKIFRKERFDFIHTFFNESPFYASCALIGNKGFSKLITTRRNMYHWIKDDPLIYHLMKLSNLIADYIMVNSYAVSDMCHRIERVDKDKIVVIQNGVDIDKYNLTTSHKARELLGLPFYNPIIGTVGNWRPVKGIAQFLKAAKGISEKIPDAHFVLVGHGPDEKNLRELAHHYQIVNQTHFLPNNTNIPLLLSALDIAVQPSLSESFSNVLIEYMAAERPIVATRVGDASHVIDDNVEGLLVEPDDPEGLIKAIFSLHQNPEKAKEMARCARKKVLVNWSSDKILKDYCSFYKNNINHH
jgi:glycosyltransferase involved in cell wall biosynthesis